MFVDEKKYSLQVQYLVMRKYMNDAATSCSQFNSYICLDGPPRGTEKDSKAIKEKTKKGQRIKHMLSI